MANPIVTSLPTYVEQHKSELIAKSVIDGKTVNRLNLMTGVIGPTTLNLVNTDVVLQDGSVCGFSASGDTTLTQRVLTPAVLKYETTFCDKNLIKTYAQHEVKIGAGRESLPFEDKFTQGIVDGVKAEIERMVWQGQSGQTDECEGFVSILNSDAATIDVTYGSGATATAKINAVYMALPTEIVTKEDTSIFVSESLYRQWMQELVAANLYHYDANYGEGEYPVTGSNVKVVATAGLNGNTYKDVIVAGRESNMFYGTDFENDNEEFDLWYSKDDQIWKLHLAFSAGVQVAFPDQVVLGQVG